MKTLRVTDYQGRVSAVDARNKRQASCLYSGNAGYDAALETVIAQLKSKYEDFDLVSTNETTGESTTYKYRDGQLAERLDA